MLVPPVRGKRVVARGARMEDVSPSYSWFSDPEVTRYLPLAGEQSLSLAEVEAFHRRASSGESEEVNLTLTLLDGEAIGCGGLRDIKDGTAELSLVIGARDLWGQKYGEEALRLILEVARGLSLESVWLLVRADNSPGVSVFEKIGFRDDGEQITGRTPGGTPYSKRRMLLSLKSKAGT